MATIEKRDLKNNETNYRVRVRLKGFPTQTASFEKLTDAKKWAQETEALIRNGKYFKITEVKKRTLSDAIERYIKTILLSKRPKDIKHPLLQLRWWKEEIGEHALIHITSAMLASCRDKLKQEMTNRGKQRTNATVNRYMATLSHVFTTAIKEWGWMETNPLIKVSKMKEPRGRTRFLSEEERVKLLQACRNSAHPYLYLVVVLCLSTGARKMEILGLKWKDIDMERKVITLHETKNGERRLLPLAGHALQLMQKHAKVSGVKNERQLVFPTRNCYEKNRPASIRAAWEKALKQAEISDFRFHDLRHSSASYLAMNGASMAEIAEVLGHKSLNMVRRYAHLSEGVCPTKCVNSCS